MGRSWQQSLLKQRERDFSNIDFILAPQAIRACPSGRRAPYAPSSTPATIPSEFPALFRCEKQIPVTNLKNMSSARKPFQHSPLPQTTV